MRIVLRVFISFMIILSGVSLWLGIELYQQREQLKGRAQKMERTLMTVVSKATAAKEPYIEAINETLDPNTLMNYFSMDGQLTKVQNIVEVRYNQLFDTKDVLKQTQDKLAQTEAELAQTKQELEKARQEIASLTEQLTQRTAELAQANAKIADLEGQIAGLNTQLEEKKQTIAKLEEDKQALFDEKTQLEVILERISKGSLGGAMRPGLSGKVIAVNPDWDFVVLNVGYKDGAKISGEMVVHRNDQIVGKVRIVDIRERLSIANINRDWVQMPIQEGDRVVY
jgi:uncharacterized phage infection (PIP) family protein YhgE